jgi:5-amino-6-(5-phospho-D-ribitylamino)uracil phosphatase
LTLVVCFDLDGTLLDKNERMHPADAALLAHPNGVIYVPATGRSLQPVKQIFARNGLFAGEVFPYPVVLQNGAELYLPGEVLHDHQTFTPETQQALLDLAFRFPHVNFLVFGLTELLSIWNTTFGDWSAQRYDFYPTPFTDAHRSLSFSKMMALSEDPAALAEVETASRHLVVEKAYSMRTIFEITPPGVNKGSGLRRLLSAMHLEGARVHAAGDGGNDLALLQTADAAFAPLTSPPEIRRAASVVVDVSQGGLLAAMG